MSTKSNIKSRKRSRGAVIDLSSTMESVPEPESELTCTVCMDALTKNIVCLGGKKGCGHAFHSTCVIQSILYKNSCPMCRAKWMAGKVEVISVPDNASAKMIKELVDKSKPEPKPTKKKKTKAPRPLIMDTESDSDSDFVADEDGDDNDGEEDDGDVHINVSHDMSRLLNAQESFHRAMMMVESNRVVLTETREYEANVRAILNDPHITERRTLRYARPFSRYVSRNTNRDPGRPLSTEFYTE
jgi:hypothetical protein